MVEIVALVQIWLFVLWMHWKAILMLALGLWLCGKAILLLLWLLNAMTE